MVQKWPFNFAVETRIRTGMGVGLFYHKQMSSAMANSQRFVIFLEQPSYCWTLLLGVTAGRHQLGRKQKKDNGKHNKNALKQVSQIANK
jgi:hypothetical protein